MKDAGQAVAENEKIAVPILDATGSPIESSTSSPTDSKPVERKLSDSTSEGTKARITDSTKQETAPNRR